MKSTKTCSNWENFALSWRRLVHLQFVWGVGMYRGGVWGAWGVLWEGEGRDTRRLGRRILLEVLVTALDWAGELVKSRVEVTKVMGWGY